MSKTCRKKHQKKKKKKKKKSYLNLKFSNSQNLKQRPQTLIQQKRNFRSHFQIFFSLYS
ncbi:hypothetical protein HanRHA438_Chr11g0488091 [Helianthus annuus]|nr:hypothetical protein HanOQP8_Chr11g0392231 [Helianthus annuus]KAJ0869339.1 hypothetical protein HanRHA438_Chr11g0488091 [Helianthus annuus]